MSISLGMCHRKHTDSEHNFQVMSHNDGTTIMWCTQCGQSFVLMATVNKLTRERLASYWQAIDIKETPLKGDGE